MLDKIVQIIISSSSINIEENVLFCQHQINDLEFNKENHNKAFNIFTKFSGVVIMFLGFCESIVYSLMFLFFKKIQKAM